MKCLFLIFILSLSVFSQCSDKDGFSLRGLKIDSALVEISKNFKNFDLNRKVVSFEDVDYFLEFSNDKLKKIRAKYKTNEFKKLEEFTKALTETLELSFFHATNNTSAEDIKYAEKIIRAAGALVIYGDFSFNDYEKKRDFNNLYLKDSKYVELVDQREKILKMFFYQKVYKEESGFSLDALKSKIENINKEIDSYLNGFKDSQFTFCNDIQLLAYFEDSIPILEVSRREEPVTKFKP